MLRAAALHLIGALALGAVAVAQVKKPDVPPGRDPGGVAVALVCMGIDYTLPALAQRLARDGEGELIGWDLESNDRRPFDRSGGSAPPEVGGDGTALAAFLAGSGARIIPVRINTGDPVTLARAIAFSAQTPARVVVLPMWGRRSEDWEPFRQAATRFKDLLIIVPEGEGGEPSYPASFGLDNVLVAGGGTMQVAAVELGGRSTELAGTRLATAAAGQSVLAALKRDPRLDVASLKRRVIQDADGGLWQPRK
jgi:hypothetical protein